MKTPKRNFAASNSLLWWQIVSVVILIAVIGLAVFNVKSRDEAIADLTQENYRLQKALEYALNRNDAAQPAKLDLPPRKNTAKK
jgi:hypothetical protein